MSTTTSPSPLTLSLLRPPLLQILRSTGFTSARPSVLDTLVDLSSRYLLLLAQHTATHTRSHTNELETGVPTMTDVRLAMTDVGALWPQISVLEEVVRGNEDMRGVEAFVGWCRGGVNTEIRRVAGFVPTATATTPVGAVGGRAALGKDATDLLAAEKEDREDFLTALKRKHAKSGAGEEGRFAGTVLGKEGEGREIRVEGWEGVEAIESWGRRLREGSHGLKAGVGGWGGDGADDVVMEEAGGSESSGSPLTEISGGSEDGE